MDDTFTQNRPLIKRLYQEERKSLKQLKEILENEHQFPESSLAFYETKLRDLLGVRKKFKREDWPIIYQHHLNSNKKNTSLYLDGVKFPWRKAWKEIRRSGAREATISRDTPLPQGIELRSSSPSAPGPASRSPPRNTCRSILPTCPLQAFSHGTDRMTVNPIIESNWSTSGFNSYSLAKNVAATSNNHVCASIGLLDVDTSIAAAATFPRNDCNSLLSNEDELILVPQNIMPLSNYTEVGASSAGIEPFYRVQLLLEDLPWQSCRLLFSTFLNGESNTQIKHQTSNGIIYSLIPRDYFSTDTSGLALARICDTTFPAPWDIRQTASNLGPSSKMEVYFFLAQAIYLFSNSLLEYDDLNTIETIKALLQLPPGTIFSFFQNDFPSIYAAWEKLLSIVIKILSSSDRGITRVWQDVDIHSVTCSLIEVALRRIKWLTEKDEDLVLAAILMSNSNLLEELLGKGACPERTQKRNKAIISAVKASSASCTKILIKGCDPNHGLEYARLYFTDKLDCISSVRRCRRPMSSYHTGPLKQWREQLSRVVDSYLEAGADVDSPCPPCVEHRELLEQTQVPKDWYPTYLDWLFQCERGLFDRVQPRSSVSETTITRHGILLAAMQGELALSVYLRSRTSQTAAEASRFLELVIREQLISSVLWKFFNIKTVKILLSIGIQIPHSDYSTCCIRVLKHCHGSKDHDSLWILNHLFQNGLVITWQIFRAAVSKEGTDMLNVLQKYVVDVGKIGGASLVRAALLGNYEAVDWLLGFGVDIKSLITDEFCIWDGLEVNTVIGIFICKSSEDPDISMLQYLVGCGAELKRTVSDQHVGGLIELFAMISPRDRTRLIPWFLDQLEVRGTGKILGDELQALYALAARTDISESFKDSTWSLIYNRLRNTYGPPPCPEAILVPMIVAGARDEMIQELIWASIDINTYSDETFNESCTPIQAAASVGNYPLVVQLSQIGADVNSPPRGRRGRTALQAICVWNPLSEEDKSRQQDIVNFLIEKGANVNAAPANDCGATAIMAAALHGDIELATVLLAHGADPNIYPWQLTSWPHAALDLAHGRCDMTKLLLNAGALSSHRGSTGYEGALWRAKDEGYNAVAGIIRDHMLQKEEQFRTQPEVRAFHNAVVQKLDLEDASRHANATYNKWEMENMEEIQRMAGERGCNYPPQPPP